MNESVFCEYCEKALSQQKGEYDHGCLDCHGQPYADKIFLLKKENKRLQAENDKLKECVEWYADEANQIAPIYPHDGRNRPGADFTQPYRMDSGKRARQVLKELDEKLELMLNELKNKFHDQERRLDLLAESNKTIETEMKLVINEIKELLND